MFPICGTIEQAVVLKDSSDLSDGLIQIRHVVEHHVGDHDIKRIGV